MGGGSHWNTKKSATVFQVTSRAKTTPHQNKRTDERRMILPQRRMPAESAGVIKRQISKMIKGKLTINPARSRILNSMAKLSPNRVVMILTDGISGSRDLRM